MNDLMVTVTVPMDRLDTWVCLERKHEKECGNNLLGAIRRILMMPDDASEEEVLAAVDKKISEEVAK